MLHEKGHHIMMISGFRAAFVVLLVLYFSQNKLLIVVGVCVCGDQHLLYRAGNRLSESYFGLSHHTGTVVFPLHPLKQEQTNRHRSDTRQLSGDDSLEHEVGEDF